MHASVYLHIYHTHIIKFIDKDNLEGVYFNWSGPEFTLQMLPVRVSQISGSLKAYLVINFRVSED